MYLLVAGVMITLTVGWLLLWQPVFDARAASESRLLAAEQTLAQVNSLAAELAMFRRDMADESAQLSASQSLPQVLNTLAAQIAIPIAALEPAADNQSAGLRFDAVSMSLLLAWLAELETLPGIRVEQLTMTPVAGDSATGEAQINASLRVRSVAQ
jgi:type II secretory pathway component PulM